MSDMKTYYTSFFITNIPSFYKLNLYNEINKHQSVFVLFTGDVIQERTKDFFSGQYDFDYVSMSGMTVFQKLQKTIKLLRTIQYKELIIGGWDSLPLWVAALWSRKSKNATVIESSDIESDFTGIKGLIKKYYMSRISKVYASGKSQVSLARKMGFKGGNIIITKGVGVFNYISQPPYKEKDKIINFVYVGRLAEEKNLKLLIRVFNQIPNLTLNIVGFGYQEEDLKEMAGNNIKFLGSINNKELPSVYQSNDVFVLPSKIEPWGLVVEEALNNGLPILLSNRIGCAEEILIEGINGFCFEYDSEESLMSAIERICDSTTYNMMAEHISKMDFSKIEEDQVKCYLHE